MRGRGGGETTYHIIMILAELLAHQLVAPLLLVGAICRLDSRDDEGHLVGR